MIDAGRSRVEIPNVAGCGMRGADAMLHSRAPRPAPCRFRPASFDVSMETF